jgi:SAM-dependent methyltransferase
MSIWQHPELDGFKADLADNEGYRYTTNAPLSSQLANQRCTEALLAMADFGGQRVIDIGCGDGTYTAELLTLAEPASVHGVDVFAQAIVTARGKLSDRRVTFAVGSASDLPYPDDSFDIALVRGVLHHMPKASEALREALRVAPTVVVLEPNGYNPGLKLFERFHPYHRAHGEMSYPPRTLDRWIRQGGGTVQRRTWAGLVPMFCPDRAAVALKKIEPGFERVPVLRAVGCAVYVFAAARAGGGPGGGSASGSSGAGASGASGSSGAGWMRGFLRGPRATQPT